MSKYLLEHVRLPFQIPSSYLIETLSSGMVLIPTHCDRQCVCGISITWNSKTPKTETSITQSSPTLLCKTIFENHFNLWKK